MIRKALLTEGAYGILTIRGPRRIGKTTLTKLLVRELLQRGVPATRIRYYSLDQRDPEGESYSPLQLIRDTPTGGTGERFLFLDEVSFCTPWATELKNAVDQGLIDDLRMKIVATGSHSMDISSAVRQLRGRQGPLSQQLSLSGNVIQSPLRFPEVVESLQPEIRTYFESTYFRTISSRFNALLQLSRGGIPPRLRYIFDNYFQLLQGTLDDYLVHGGYPRAINEFNTVSPRQVAPDFYYNVADLLISDCQATELDPENLVRVIQMLVDPLQLSNQLNLAGQVIVRGEAGAPRGRFDMKRYLDYLRDTWSFFFAYPEANPCSPNYQGQQKAYILDPFLYHALFSRVNNIPDPFINAGQMIARSDFKGRLVESVIASHLLLSQFLFQHTPGIDFDRVLMFQRTNVGENDFVLCITKSGTPHRLVLESKYSSDPTGYNRLPVTGKIVITKDRFEQRGDVILVPASVFLLLF